MCSVPKIMPSLFKNETLWLNWGRTPLIFWLHTDLDFCNCGWVISLYNSYYTNTSKSLKNFVYKNPVLRSIRAWNATCVQLETCYPVNCSVYHLLIELKMLFIFFKTSKECNDTAFLCAWNAMFILLWTSNCLINYKFIWVGDTWTVSLREPSDFGLEKVLKMS